MKILYLIPILAILILIPTVQAGYAPICNSTEVDNTSCGGYKMRMVLTCANYSGTYDWNSTATLCDFSCYEGECETFDIENDYCSDGEVKCAGNYLVKCNQTDDGNYDWSFYNMTYCDKGCLNNKCMDRISQCDSDEYYAESNIIKNCTQLADGTWVWTDMQYCEYGVVHTYSDEKITNITCQEVGDAHHTQNAIKKGANELGFIFSPVKTLVYIIVSLIISIYASVKVDSSNLAYWMFIGLVVVGSVPPISVIPVTVSVILIGLCFGIRLGGLHE